MDSISFNTAIGNLKRSNGYGVASFNIITALQRLGLKVPFDDPDPKVQINFCQPMWFNLRPGQFQIGYVPWESTKLPIDWIDPLVQCDQVWVPSNWCKNVFVGNGIPVDRVYHHGIESVWKTPILRSPSSTLKFLHVGSPAARKSGQLVVDAFLKAFQKNDDVSLTIKCSGYTEARWKDERGNILGPLTNLPNIKIIPVELEEDQLLKLYLDHDVLVYPSMGEGFGLIPIQALATGMPSIVTEAWCDYKNYILPVEAKLGPTKWEVMHPGEIYYPDLDNIIFWMRELYHNFDKYAKKSYEQADDLYLEYDWDRLTLEAFQDLLQKF